MLSCLSAYLLFTGSLLYNRTPTLISALFNKYSDQLGHKVTHSSHQITDILEFVFREINLPFCRIKKYHFLKGWGTADVNENATAIFPNLTFSLSNPGLMICVGL